MAPTYSTFAHHPDPQPRCSHELKYSPDAEFICDGCRSRDCSEKWSCSICDFALCKVCYQSEIEARERPAEQPEQKAGLTGKVDHVLQLLGADQTRTTDMLLHQAKMCAFSLIFVLLCGAVVVPSLALTTASPFLAFMFPFVCFFIFLVYGVSFIEGGFFSIAAYLCVGTITICLFSNDATALHSFLAQGRQGDMQIALVPEIKTVVNKAGEAVVLTEAVRVAPEWIQGVYSLAMSGGFNCFVPVISATQKFNLSADTVQVFTMCFVRGNLCNSSSLWDSECARNWHPNNASRIIITDIGEETSKVLIDTLHNNPPPFRWSLDLIVVTWEPVTSAQERESQHSRLIRDFTVAAFLLPAFYVCCMFLLMVSRLRGTNEDQVCLYAWVQIAVALPFLILGLIFATLACLILGILIFLGTMMTPTAYWRDGSTKAETNNMAWYLVIGLVNFAWKTRDSYYITFLGLVTTLPTFIGPLLMVYSALQIDDDLQKVALPSTIPDNHESLPLSDPIPHQGVPPVEPPKCRCTCANILTIFAVLVEFLQCCAFAIRSLPPSSTAESGFVFPELLLAVVMNLDIYYTDLGIYYTEYYSVLYWVVFGLIMFHLLMWFLVTKYDFQCKFLFQNVEPLFSGLLFFPFIRIMLSPLKCSVRDNLLVVDAFPGMYCYLGWHYGYLTSAEIVLGSYIAFVIANPSGSYKSSVSAKLDLRLRTIYVIAVNFIKVFMQIATTLSQTTALWLNMSLVGCLSLGFLTLAMAPSPFVALNFLQTLLYFFAAWAIMTAKLLESRDLNQIILVLGLGWAVELALALLLFYVDRSWFTIDPNYVTTESQIRQEHLGRRLIEGRERREERGREREERR